MAPFRRHSAQALPQAPPPAPHPLSGLLIAGFPKSTVPRLLCLSFCILCLDKLHGFNYSISDNFQISVSCQDLPSEMWMHRASCHSDISTSTWGMPSAEPSKATLCSFPRRRCSQVLSQKHGVVFVTSFSFKHNVQSLTVDLILNISQSWPLCPLSCVGVE